RVFRFFTAGANLEALARQQANVDYVQTHGLLATTGPEAWPVGHGLYVQTAAGRAEVAFEIADAMQGVGLGTILLGQLAERAAANGIHTFEAEVLPQNHRMLAVFRESGLPIAVRAGFDQIHVEFPTSLTPAAVERFELREQTAAVNALNRFFN